MNLFRKTAAAVLIFIPWLFRLPYLLSAWKSSPADRMDWIFPVWFLIWFLWIIFGKPSGETAKRTANRTDWILLFSGAAITGAGYSLSIHMIQIAGSVFFAWRGCVLIYGGKTGEKLLFPFIILLFATASSNYWISSFCGIGIRTAWLLKTAFSFLLTAAAAMPLRVRSEPLLFLSVLGFGLILWQETGHFAQSSPPLQPRFSVFPDRKSGFVGRSIRPAEAMIRFFRSGEIACYQFADDSRTYQVLDVRCGRNIHEIHPAGHCLRSSGAEIRSEKRREYRIRGRNYHLREIFAAGRFSRELVVVWYSDRNLSVGSFLAFRNRWSAETDWHAYQISVRLDHDPDAARKGIRKLLETLTPPE